MENLEFIHPAEVEICNKLAELGNFYKQIYDFHENYSFAKSFENKPLKSKIKNFPSLTFLFFYFYLNSRILFICLLQWAKFSGSWALSIKDKRAGNGPSQRPSSQRHILAVSSGACKIKHLCFLTFFYLKYLALHSVYLHLFFNWWNNL